MTDNGRICVADEWHVTHAQRILKDLPLDHSVQAYWDEWFKENVPDMYEDMTNTRNSLKNKEML